MPRPMDLGRAVLFAGSALLLISLFTEWYDIGLTGWQVFETLDLVLAALAVGGMVASVRADLLPPWSGFALPGAALFIVAVQLIDGPPAAGGSGLSSGAWVALAGTLLMAGGSALSLSAISVTVQFSERDLRRRVPAVDRRNADAEDELDDDARYDAEDETPPGSLFASGLGGGEESGAEPRRTGRFAPRPTEPEAAAAVARGTSSGGEAASSSGRGSAPGAVGSSGLAGSPPRGVEPRDVEPRGVEPRGAVGGGPVSGTPASGRSGGADDLERTQPLTDLPDEADEPERP
jgi:hypothetical protein